MTPPPDPTPADPPSEPADDRGTPSGPAATPPVDPTPADSTHADDRRTPGGPAVAGGADAGPLVDSTPAASGPDAGATSADGDALSPSDPAAASDAGAEPMADGDASAGAVSALTPEEMAAAVEDMPVCGTAARAMEELAGSSPSSDGAVPVLELRDVTASYGAFRALFGLSLSIAPGEAVALLGANGAGKTTVARVATGLVAPTGGSVHVDGENLTGKPAWRFARAGVIHAPEGRSVFASLSVEENLTLSFRQSSGRSGVKPRLERAFELFPVLGKRRDQLAGTMSGGEQRMLSMARVLVESPRLLVADELSLGLAPVVVDEVYATLERLRTAGTALLIVEQHIGHALALCSRVVVEDHGAVQWEGPSSEAASHVVTEVFEAAS